MLTLIVAALCTSRDAMAIDPVAPYPIQAQQRLPLLLRKLDQGRRALYVTAHPDDENEALIARLVHGEGIDVALMTLTRGGGGQNEIGGELFRALAALRTEELLANRRYDGATQYFGTAPDFGYSFSVDETFAKWDRERELDQIVRVIREFRPGVLFTMNPEGTGGGQHHQASARLATEAFDLAARRDYKPELGAPHTTARLFTVLFDGGTATHPCDVELGRYDAILGCSYAEFGLRARAMHKCQGMVRIEEPFLERTAHLDLRARRDVVNADNEERQPLEHPFAGLTRPLFFALEGTPVPEQVRASVSAELERLAELARDGYRPETPDTIAAILGGYIATLERDPELLQSPTGQTLYARASEALAVALGLRCELRADQPFIAAGRPLQFQIAIENHGPGRITASLELDQDVLDTKATSWRRTITLASGERQSISYRDTVPQAAYPTIYGSVQPDRPNLARFGRARLRGWRLTGSFRWNAHDYALPVTPARVLRRDERFPAIRSTVPQIVPDPSLRPRYPVVIATESDDRPALGAGELLLSTLAAGPVRVTLEVDRANWRVEPAALEIASPGAGTEIAIPFRVHATARLSTAERVHVIARARRLDAKTDTAWSEFGYRVIDYPHIRRVALLERASVEVSAFRCHVPTRHVAYIEGTGDAVFESLTALGCDITPLRASDFTEERLAAFDTILTGVRAYKVRPDLIAAQPTLLAWVRAGGTLVVQYNKFELNDASGASPYVPYPGARVGSRRVTVEESPITNNAPSHPLFTTPNTITTVDWQGWVQERGLYFLDLPKSGATPSPYLDLLTLEDPWPYNAGTKGGALVEAKVGDGYWIYVGLGLWRQLPAGVPGAYRLMSNLIER